MKEFWFNFMMKLGVIGKLNLIRLDDLNELLAKLSSHVRNLSLNWKHSMHDHWRLFSLGEMEKRFLNFSFYQEGLGQKTIQDLVGHARRNYYVFREQQDEYAQKWIDHQLSFETMVAYDMGFVTWQSQMLEDLRSLTIYFLKYVASDQCQYKEIIQDDNSVRVLVPTIAKKLNFLKLIHDLSKRSFYCEYVSYDEAAVMAKETNQYLNKKAAELGLSIEFNDDKVQIIKISNGKNNWK